MANAEVSFRRDLLGVDYPVTQVDVSLDKLREYCRLIGEDNPLYTDPETARRWGFRSALAPPTFLAMYVSARKYPNIELQFPGVMVKGGQSIQLLQPVHEGDVLDLKVHLERVYTKTGRSGTMAFVVWETTFTRQDGNTVALAQDYYVYYPRQRNKA